MISVGSYVQVPQTPGNITAFCQRGFITAITPRYCKVLIRYGRKMKGFWEGRIKDITELESPTKEQI